MSSIQFLVNRISVNKSRLELRLSSVILRTKDNKYKIKEINRCKILSDLENWILEHVKRCENWWYGTWYGLAWYKKKIFRQSSDPFL